MHFPCLMKSMSHSRTWGRKSSWEFLDVACSDSAKPLAPESRRSPLQLSESSCRATSDFRTCVTPLVSQLQLPGRREPINVDKNHPLNSRSSRLRRFEPSCNSLSQKCSVCTPFVLDMCFSFSWSKCGDFVDQKTNGWIDLENPEKSIYIKGAVAHTTAQLYSAVF